mmetsp:Transcript_25535/g.45006  ORF Transcript_25535/g.45006 Transcript_25535/m.45006 type:complete len:569 (+) Transcript_25535:514-2220(+)
MTRNSNHRSIIDMANAAYSMTSSSTSSSNSNDEATTMMEPKTKDNNRTRTSSATTTVSSGSHSTGATSTGMSLDERLDAARSLLGISPSSVADSTVATPFLPSFGGRGIMKPQKAPQAQPLLFGAAASSSTAPTATVSSQDGGEPSASHDIPKRPRSDSAGLEALAFLATQQQDATATSTTSSSNNNTTTATVDSVLPLAPTIKNKDNSDDVPEIKQGLFKAPKVAFSKPLVASAVSSSDDDSEAMPPPPPRNYKNSNTIAGTISTTRRRSVSNPEGMEKWAPRDCYSSSSSSNNRRLRLVLPASILEEELAEASAAMKAKEETTTGAHDDYVNHHHRGLFVADEGAPQIVGSDGDGAPDSGYELHEQEHHEDYDDDEEEEEEENLDHDELLRRARSRLLEDLSQGNLSGEKGVLTLPHSLDKYKEVYNKNGRIGIYTPAERAAIIARFQSKRSRRVWNKKIRYNCRKNLADRRLRVKGRFVKRSALEQQHLQEQQHTEGEAATTTTTSSTTTVKKVTVASIPEGMATTDAMATENEDVDMPDVNDPDAGFCPTDDQPYRRLRRHTIT